MSNVRISEEMRRLLEKSCFRANDNMSDYEIPEGLYKHPTMKYTFKGIAERAVDFARHNQAFRLHLSLNQVLYRRRGLKGMPDVTLNFNVNTTRRNTISQLVRLTENSSTKKRMRLCVQDSILAYLLVHPEKHLLIDSDFNEVFATYDPRYHNETPSDSPLIDPLRLHIDGKPDAWDRIIELQKSPEYAATYIR